MNTKEHLKTTKIELKNATIKLDKQLKDILVTNLLDCKELKETLKNIKLLKNKLKKNGGTSIKSDSLNAARSIIYSNNLQKTENVLDNLNKLVNRSDDVYSLNKLYQQLVKLNKNYTDIVVNDAVEACHKLLERCQEIYREIIKVEQNRIINESLLTEYIKDYALIYNNAYNKCINIKGIDNIQLIFDKLKDIMDFIINEVIKDTLLKDTPEPTSYLRSTVNEIENDLLVNYIKRFRRPSQRGGVDITYDVKQLLSKKDTVILF